MAGAERQSDLALIREIAKDGRRYEFFSAVHLIHRLRTGGAPLGELGPLSREPLRFRHDPDLIFHASDISSLEIDSAGRVALTSSFLGLYGAASPMAIHFSEDVIAAENSDQPSLREFYDLFHHRVLSLFYRAWKKYRLDAGFTLAGDDASTKRMLCFVGVDAYGTHKEPGLTRLEMLELAPLLAMKARSPRLLKLALGKLLPGIGVEVEQFVERRARIDDEDRFALGRRCHELGRSTTLGTHVRDRSARFRLLLGPVSYEECESLMPGGAKFPVLRRTVDQFTRGTLECEVDVLLREEEGPGFCLGSTRGATLGVNTRLGGARSKTAASSTRMRFVLSEDADEARARLVTDTFEELAPS